MKTWAKSVAWVLAVLIVGVLTMQFFAPELAQSIIRGKGSSGRLYPETASAVLVQFDGEETALITEPELLQELLAALQEGTGEVVKRHDTPHLCALEFLNPEGFDKMDVYSGSVEVHPKLSSRGGQLRSFDSSALEELLQRETDPLAGLTDPEHLEKVLASYVEGAQDPLPLPEAEWADFCAAVDSCFTEEKYQFPMAHASRYFKAVVCSETLVAIMKVNPVKDGTVVWMFLSPNTGGTTYGAEPKCSFFFKAPEGNELFARWLAEE